MAHDKIQTIQDWPEPRKVKDIQSFLGFANFYQRFIQDYSGIVVLTRLTHKGVPWNFLDDCRRSFTRLKKAFISAPVLVHWSLDAPITIETDTSDYAIAGILSLTCSDNEIHPIAFYSHTLSGAELNYDTHDKELLAIFEGFKSWRHYLEGSATPIDIVTDHKNLEYFSTTKLLMRHQVRWLEYLCQFNMVVRYQPGKLRAKPDALTRCWDVYPKEGNKDFTRVNPDNFRPIFSNEQLTASLRAMYLEALMLRASVLLDVEQLHSDILSSLPNDPAASPLISAESIDDPRWKIDSKGFLLQDNCIYIPEANDLCLHILRIFQNHPTAGHFGQNHTLELIRCEYTWPNIRTFVKDYVSSCMTCSHAKVPRHRPYGLLKQLPIPEKPWNSISMDFIEQLPPSVDYTTILVVAIGGTLISLDQFPPSAGLTLMFLFFFSVLFVSLRFSYILLQLQFTTYD